VRVPAGPKSTAYLPNATETLGGADGWTTPFIVQDVDTVTGLLGIELYRFSDGALAMTRDVRSIAPGTSYACSPQAEAALPGETQYSVVIRAYLIDAIAVVNEHAGSGMTLQPAAYVGATRGATSVSLPNATKRFFGFVAPFIIQNLGTAATTATASLVSFDGTRHAVTVTTSQPLAVAVNTHGYAAPRRAPIPSPADPWSTRRTGSPRGRRPCSCRTS